MDQRRVDLNKVTFFAAVSYVHLLDIPFIMELTSILVQFFVGEFSDPLLMFACQILSINVS